MKLYTMFNICFFMNICMFDMFKGILQKHHVIFAFILCSYVYIRFPWKAKHLDKEIAKIQKDEVPHTRWAPEN